MKRALLGTMLLAAIATACTVPGSQSEAGRSSANERGSETAGANRARFAQMLARSWYPGRTGQLLIVPREGEFITRPEPQVAFMHGSPWWYDVSIPLLFAGPAVKSGTYSVPAAQEDVAPTLAAALGVAMPATASGHVLPVLRSGFPQPRAVMLLVLDGMRRDYFDRYVDVIPNLSALRQRSAWFSQAQLDVLPSNTAVGHSTISTGAPPSVHGITGNNVYNRVAGRRHEFFADRTSRELMAMTLSDVWQLATAGRAIVIAQGSVERAATALAGHGACQLNGVPVILASYDVEGGGWSTNTECFRLPEYLKNRNAKTFWPADGTWMGHKIDTPRAFRYSALFPAFEADAMIAMLEQEPVGQDDVPDLVLMNYKVADYVGHHYGPDSKELRAALGEMDRHLARILRALEARVGSDYLLAVTADHGMPTEPSHADGRIFSAAVIEILHKQFDPEGKRLIPYYEPENGQIFVDEARLSELGLKLGDLVRFLEAQPFVFAVFTHEEIRSLRMQ